MLLETNCVRASASFVLHDPFCIRPGDVHSETSGQAGLPAEFKHINKRRKRN